MLREFHEMHTMITPIFFLIFSFSKLLGCLGNVQHRIPKLEMGSRVVPQGREEDFPQPEEYQIDHPDLQCFQQFYLPNTLLGKMYFKQLFKLLNINITIFFVFFVDFLIINTKNTHVFLSANNSLTFLHLFNNSRCKLNLQLILDIF